MGLKILFLTNIPSPYRVDFFNEVGKSVELTVLFEKRTSKERNKSWSEYHFKNFTGFFLKGVSVTTDTSISPFVIAKIKEYKNDVIIVANPLSPTGMIAIQYMKINTISYFTEGDGGFSKNGKGIVEQIKKHFLKGANGYFSTSKSFDEYYLTYGATKDKIYRYPFTSLHEEDVLSAPITENEKRKIRQELGLDDKKTVITVGQFIYRKGFDILLKAWTKINNDINLIIIGGGEEEKAYKQFINDNNLKNIKILDFKPFNEILKYFKACDLFVLPTREDIWGLVVNEAMACSLPVITTDRCIAGLELVKDDENGYIVPVGDVDMLAEKINYILNNDDTREKMSQSSLEKIKPYTIENMAKSHMDIFEKLLMS